MRWFLVVLGLVLTNAAFASDFYAGGSVGQSSAKLSNRDFTTPTVQTTSTHTDGAALKLFGGYDLSKYFAIEGGFTRMGKPNFTTRDSTTGANAGRSFVAHSWNIAGKATLPLPYGFSLFGKLRATRNYLKDYFTPSGMLEVHDSRTGALYGAGVGYSLSKNLSLRAEYEDYGSFGSDP